MPTSLRQLYSRRRNKPFWQNLVLEMDENKMISKTLLLVVVFTAHDISRQKCHRPLKTQTFFGMKKMWILFHMALTTKPSVAAKPVRRNTAYVSINEFI